MNNDDDQLRIDDDKAADMGFSTAQVLNRMLQINRIQPQATNNLSNNDFEQPTNHLFLGKNQADVSFGDRNSSRLSCMSPPPQLSTATSRLLMNTPQTPNTISSSSYFDSKAADYWTNGLKPASLSRLNLTPPLSASKTSTETSFYVEPLASSYANIEIPTDDFKHSDNKSVFVSSPIPRVRYDEFANYNVGSTANPSLLSVSNNRETGFSQFVNHKPPPGFNIQPYESSFSNTNDMILEGNTNNFSALNIKTNFSPIGSSIYSPVLRSPR